VKPVMKGFFILSVVAIVIVAISGCVHTPAKVAEETPHVLKNISNDLSTMETPNITLETVLQPLKTSMNYTLPIELPTPTDIVR
jgi:hypothetical protein